MDNIITALEWGVNIIAAFTTPIVAFIVGIVYLIVWFEEREAKKP